MDKEILDIAEIYENEVAQHSQPNEVVNENIFHNIGGAVKAGTQALKQNVKNVYGGDKGEGKNVFTAAKTGFYRTRYTRMFNIFKNKIAKYLDDFENDINKLGVDLTNYPNIQKGILTLRNNLRGSVDMELATEHVELAEICEGVMSRWQSKAHGYTSGIKQGLSNVGKIFTGKTQNAMSSKKARETETIRRRVQLFIDKCNAANEKFKSQFPNRKTFGMPSKLLKTYKGINFTISTMEQDIKGLF